MTRVLMLDVRFFVKFSWYMGYGIAKKNSIEDQLTSYISSYTYSLYCLCYFLHLFHIHVLEIISEVGKRMCRRKNKGKKCPFQFLWHFNDNSLPGVSFNFVQYPSMSLFLLLKDREKDFKNQKFHLNIDTQR